MGIQQLFIIGSSLFADSLVQILTNEGGVTVIGIAATTETAFFRFEEDLPDAVIVATPIEIAQTVLGLILITYPNLPVIYANPNAEYMQVITSQLVGAKPADLLAILLKLTKKT